MKKSSSACKLYVTMDACVLLEGPSCTLCRALECFEVDRGAAMALFDFDSRFISHARLFSTEHHFKFPNAPLEGFNDGASDSIVSFSR